MDMSHVAGMRGWIEELSVKNKSLEKKIKTLKNKSPNSLNQLEEKNSKLKQKIKSLKLVRKENGKLKEEIESLKLENSQLKGGGPEIIEVSSDSEDENNEQSNPRRRSRLDCGGLDFDSTHEGQSNRNETHPTQNNPLIREKGNRKKRKVGQTSTSFEITRPINNPLMTKHLLSIFMAYVAPRDLGACRLVSKLWNVEATKQNKMRYTFSLDFCYPQMLNGFLEIAPTFSGFRNFDMGIRLNKYSDTLFMNQGKPLHRVMEFGRFGRYGVNEVQDLFLDSFQEIKFLNLHGFPCALLRERRIFFDQLLSNLTEINVVFESNCRDDHEDTECHGNFFQIAPNLKTIHWEEKQNGRGHNGAKMMIESLIRIKPPRLEKLFLHSKVDSSVVTLLANSQLKLKRLYFSKLKQFKVDLAATCTGLQTSLTPLRRKYSQIPGQELKEYLENRLANFKQALCIALLKVFLTTLAAKLRAGSGG